MDDILLMASTLQECLVHRRELIVLLQRLGWFISPEKSHLDPSQVRDHLGFTIDTQEEQVLIRVQGDKRKTVAKEV